MPFVTGSDGGEVERKALRCVKGENYRVAQKKRPTVFQGLITALEIDVFARNFQR